MSWWENVNVFVSPVEEEFLSPSVTDNEVFYSVPFHSVLFLRPPAHDCAVGEWSFWSGCAEPCQPSVRVRVRQIERQPSHSGERCPGLKEQSGCREYRDRRGEPCGRHTGTRPTKTPGFFRYQTFQTFAKQTFPFQVLRSSPAWSLPRGGPSTTTTATPSTLGTSQSAHRPPAILRVEKFTQSVHLEAG